MMVGGRRIQLKNRKYQPVARHGRTTLTKETQHMAWTTHSITIPSSGVSVVSSLRNVKLERAFQVVGRIAHADRLYVHITRAYFDRFGKPRASAMAEEAKTSTLVS